MSGYRYQPNPYKGHLFVLSAPRIPLRRLRPPQPPRPAPEGRISDSSPVLATAGNPDRVKQGATGPTTPDAGATARPVPPDGGACETLLLSYAVECALSNERVMLTAVFSLAAGLRLAWVLASDFDPTTTGFHYHMT